MGAANLKNIALKRYLPCNSLEPLKKEAPDHLIGSLLSLVDSKYISL